MQIVPFTSDPSQTFDVVLGETKVSIAARWRDSTSDDDPGGWTFDLIRAEDQETLVAGVPLLIGEDMLGPYALGLGGLIVFDEDGAFVDAGPEDLGERVKVAWLSEDELEAVRDAGGVL